MASEEAEVAIETLQMILEMNRRKRAQVREGSKGGGGGGDGGGGVYVWEGAGAGGGGRRHDRALACLGSVPDHRQSMNP